MSNKQLFWVNRKAAREFEKNRQENLTDEEKLEIKLMREKEDEITKRLADENKRMRLIYGKIEILQPLPDCISFPEHYNYPNIKDEDIRIMYIDFSKIPIPITKVGSLPKSIAKTQTKTHRKRLTKEERDLIPSTWDPYSPYGPVVTPSPVDSLLITANNKTDVFIFSEVKEDENSDN